MPRDVVYTTRFPEIIAIIPQILDTAVGAGAKMIEQTATERAPVATGRLRDSIHTDRKGHAEYEVVAGDNQAWYGHLVEFGTSRSAAHPFLVPAEEERRAEVIAMVEVELHRL